MSTRVSYPQAGSPGAVCVSLAPVSHHGALFTSEIALPFSGYSSSQEKDCELMSEGGQNSEQIVFYFPSPQSWKSGVFIRQKDAGC